MCAQQAFLTDMAQDSKSYFSYHFLHKPWESISNAYDRYLIQGKYFLEYQNLIVKRVLEIRP